jgi:hypothetical protein
MSRFLRAASLLALIGGVACTAIVTNEEAIQCKTNADCTTRGPDFVGTTCQSGFCQISSASTSPTDIPGATCHKNADCASKGDGFVCASNTGQCAPTKSDICDVAYGNPTEEGTVLYGLLSELGQKDTNFFRQQQYKYAAKLAFTEFFDNTNVRFAGGRKGALIACSQAHSPRAVAAFLANMGVKAVLGPSAEELQQPVVETLLPARIPSFSPWINGNPASVVEGAANYAWLATFRRADIVAPLNAYIAEKEKVIRAVNGNNPIRIAVVVNQSSPPPATPVFNQYGEFADLMDKQLVFNGKSAVENGTDPGCTGNACYKRFDTNQADKATVTSRATAIAAFNPDLIIPFADIDWGAQLLPAIEAAVATSASKPTYVQPFIQIEDQGYKSFDLTDQNVRTRFGGIRAVRDNSFEVFSSKFKASIPSPSNPAQVGPDPNPGAGRSFETALLILLSSYAAFLDDPNASPEKIIAALPKVTDSKAATRVTLIDLQNGVAQLNQKTTINFDGLFSQFDFDYSTHSTPATWTTWCVDNLGRYNSSGRTFTGTAFDGAYAPCP